VISVALQFHAVRIGLGFERVHVAQQRLQRVYIKFRAVLGDDSLGGLQFLKVRWGLDFPEVQKG